MTQLNFRLMSINDWDNIMIRCLHNVIRVNDTRRNNNWTNDGRTGTIIENWI